MDVNVNVNVNVDVNVNVGVDVDVDVDGDGDGDVAVDDRSLHVRGCCYTISMLSFRKLDVYRCAIEFLALTAEAAEQIPRGNAVLLDQLRRAAVSIPLNIAEAQAVLARRMLRVLTLSREGLRWSARLC